MAFSSVQVQISQGWRTLPPLKAPPKTHRVFRPYQNNPFMFPTTTERASYRKRSYGGKFLSSSNQSFSSGRGKSTQEASGVVFDPIQGDEGVNHPPSDSFQATLSPPVGGRLHSFRKDWLTNKCSDYVLNIITNGDVLPFISKPNLVRAPLILSGYKAFQKEQALTSCIQSLLSKNAIERVENVKSCGFYSRTQASPRWKPVIDIGWLNTFLLVEKFNMETPESIRACLIPGEWVSLIDLSDAYLHIPILPNFS